MIIFWSLLFAVPLLGCGILSALSPDKAGRGFAAFAASRSAAIALTLIAWAWTAWEVAIFDVNIVGDLLGGLSHGPFAPVVALLSLGFEYFWALTPFLAYLTIIWMEKNLPVRALSGILMLIPSELFKTTRHYLPADGGFAPVHILIVAAYIGAVIGMYGMFYPWRIEKAAAFIFSRRTAARTAGAIAAAFGAAVFAVAIFARRG